MQKNMLSHLETPTTTAIITGEAASENELITTPFPDDFDFDIDSSACSTPFVSAPSSPGRNNAHLPFAAVFYYSAPTSPMHFMLSTNSQNHLVPISSPVSSACSFEFDFSARLSTNGTASVGSMSTADELFLNGQIRPMKLSTHLQNPQVLAPLLDLDESQVQSGECEVKRGRAPKFRDKTLRRRTRSMSPLRTLSSFDWSDDFGVKSGKNDDKEKMKHMGIKCQDDSESTETMTNNPSDSSGAPSRSSSAGRGSKRWVFLKDFLYRSKSEGRNNGQNKFWGSLSFSPSKEKIKTEKNISSKIPSFSLKDKEVQSDVMAAACTEVKRKAAVNGVGKRRGGTPSAHEVHYTTKRAEAEEMRKKTFLPYRQGLLGCLGFTPKSYGAMHGFGRAFNPVSSR